jgi:hypothetical protein
MQTVDGRDFTSFSWRQGLEIALVNAREGIGTGIDAAKKEVLVEVE